MSEKIQAEARAIASGPGMTDTMRAALASMLTKVPVAGASTWGALERRGLVRWVRAHRSAR